MPARRAVSTGLLGLILLAELTIAAGLLSRPAPPAPLVVGDHRTVELIGTEDGRTAALLDRVAAQIGPAVSAVEGFWGTDWSRRIVVEATATPAGFAAAAGAPVAADTAAVTVAASVDPWRRQATGQRIVLAPGAGQMSPAALRIVLGHELFHYATRAVTAVDAPRWLTEGVADFVARAPAAVPDGTVLTLPSDAELDAAGPGRANAYDRAWWFARFVADRYGADRLRALYLAACGVGRTDLADAVQRTLGAGLPDLLAGWQRWATG